jgi:Na+-driven multidrug efflux pump
LRSEGAAKLASIGMIIGAVGNMLLDPLFIPAFKMGVKGAERPDITAQTAERSASIETPSSLSMVIMSLAVVVGNTLASGYETYVIADSGIIILIWTVFCWRVPLSALPQQP